MIGCRSPSSFGNFACRLRKEDCASASLFCEESCTTKPPAVFSVASGALRVEGGGGAARARARGGGRGGRPRSEGRAAAPLRYARGRARPVRSAAARARSGRCCAPPRPLPLSGRPAPHSTAPRPPPARLQAGSYPALLLHL